MSERKKKLKYFFQNERQTSKKTNLKKLKHYKMSTSTFTGSVNVGAFDKAAKSLVGDYVRQALEFIADKYKFSAEDALRDLNMEEMSVKRPLKKTTKKVEKPSIPMPWTGVVSDESCQGLRLNHKLYTQCTGKKVEDGDFCKTCVKQVATNSSGKPNYGTVEDRKEVDALEFRDPKGQQVLPYANVMKKLGISQEKVNEEALKFGLEIADEQFVVREPARGRKKKEVATEDTPTDGTKSKRGRPKKDKKVVSNTGDDLIAALVANVQNTETGSDAEIEPLDDGVAVEILDAGTLAMKKKTLTQKQKEKVEAKAARELARKEKAEEKEAKRLAFEEKKKAWAAKKELAAQEKETKRLEREAKKAEKDAEKEVKRLAAEAKKVEAAEKKAKKEAEKEEKRLAAEEKKKIVADKKAALEAEKEVKRLAREAKKAEKDAKRLVAEEKKKAAAEKKAALEADKAELAKKIADEKAALDAPELTVEPIAESEDDETEVTKFEHNGITYLKDSNNVLYDMETQEEIGTWDEGEKCIQDLEDDSEAESEAESEN